MGRLAFIFGMVLLAGCRMVGGGQGASTVASGRGLTVAELLRIGNRPGEYMVEGYLVGVELCSPCPEGAACEQCRDENIAISDQPVLVQGYTAPNQGYLILRPMARSYIVGRRYRWKVKIPEHGPLGEYPPSVGYEMEAGLLP
jgi:hypothetical protein